MEFQLKLPSHVTAKAFRTVSGMAWERAPNNHLWAN